MGLAGLAGVLIAAPLAYAETPGPTPTPSSSTAQPAEAPTPSRAPGAAVSPTPAGTASASASPTPTPSPTASAAGPTSAGPAPTTSTATEDATPRSSVARLEPDYGLTKIRVGARVAPGSTPPDGTTTTGSVLHFAHVVGTPGEFDGDCTTVGPPDEDGVTFCPDYLLVGTGDSLVVTQVSAPEGLRVDGRPRTATSLVDCRPAQFCYGAVVVLDDPAVDAPVATDDEAETTPGRSADLDLLANDDLYDRDVTSLTTTAAAHGTVTVVDATTGAVRYVPDRGFRGEDTFTYTVVTGAGSSTATVTVEVRRAAPAPDPSTSTGAGSAASGGGSDGTSVLAATGLTAGAVPLGLGGVVLIGAGTVLLRRRRPRGDRA